MEQEKKVVKTPSMNNLTRSLEIQNEHNLLIGDCLSLLKRSMLNLYGQYVSEECTSKISDAEVKEGSNSLVERLEDLNGTRDRLLNEMHANLRSMLEQSEIRN